MDTDGRRLTEGLPRKTGWGTKRETAVVEMGTGYAVRSTKCTAARAQGARIGVGVGLCLLVLFCAIRVWLGIW